MPVRKRAALYNDPAVGQIFDNLSSMFAPPKAADTYAYAKARAEQQAMDFKTQAAAALTDPNASVDQQDRVAYLAGLYNPTQGIGARNMNDATARRGQDVTASTSITNNTADNARALATNSADNQRAMDVAMIAPVAAGATRFTPPEIASRYGVAPAQVGVLNASPGDTIYAPGATGAAGGGEVFSGTTKPLTESEQKAADLAALPAGERRMVALQGVKTGGYVGPGGLPITAFDTVAADRGLAPAPKDVAPSDLGRLQQERDQAVALYGASDPRIKEFNDRIAKLGSGGTTVNVGAGEKALDTGFAAADVKDITAATEAQDEAIRSSAKNEILRESLKAGPSGFGAGVQAYLSDKGIKLGENAGALELSQALINSAIPSQRIAGSGTTSDKDMAIFAKSLPSILNTPGGNEAILDLHQAMNQRTIKIGDLATQARDREITPAQFRAAVRALPDPLTEFNKARAAGNGVAPAAPAGAPAAPSAPTSGPVRVNSPAEAAALAPGTQFMTPDGKLKVRP